MPVRPPAAPSRLQLSPVCHWDGNIISCFFLRMEIGLCMATDSLRHASQKLVLTQKSHDLRLAARCWSAWALSPSEPSDRESETHAVVLARLMRRRQYLRWKSAAALPLPAGTFSLWHMAMSIPSPFIRRPAFHHVHNPINTHAKPICPLQSRTV